MSLENPCTFWLVKEKTWKRIFNTNRELSQHRAKKQIMSAKTTINWLFNDLCCYLFIACFDWKTDVFQQAVVRVYYILNNFMWLCLVWCYQWTISKNRVKILWVKKKIMMVRKCKKTKKKKEQMMMLKQIDLWETYHFTLISTNLKEKSLEKAVSPVFRHHKNKRKRSSSKERPNTTAWGLFSRCKSEKRGTDCLCFPGTSALENVKG